MNEKNNAKNEFEQKFYDLEEKYWDLETEHTELKKYLNKLEKIIIQYQIEELNRKENKK